MTLSSRLSLDSRLSDELLACLSQLLEHGTAVWQRYLQRGPGRQAGESFESVSAASRRLEQLICLPRTLEALQAAGVDPCELEAAIWQALELARRCACTAQGLCFISGEAGLIPRRDQHQAFDAALSQLTTTINRLQQSAPPTDP